MELDRERRPSSDAVKLFECSKRLEAARALTAFAGSGSEVELIMAAHNSDLSNLHKVASDLADQVHDLQILYAAALGTRHATDVIARMLDGGHMFN